eukprot:gene45660-56893_t
MGGETGSGKTLAYMLPLIEKALELNTFSAKRLYPSIAIIAPNKDLCRQIMNMTKNIFQGLKDEGFDIPIEMITESTTYWPYTSTRPAPYFIVTTPAIYSTYTTSREVDGRGMMKELRHLVLDEADMILDGSFLKMTEGVLHAAKLARKEMIREKTIGLHDKTLQTILSAATIPSHGMLSVQNFVGKNFRRV